MNWVVCLTAKAQHELAELAPDLRARFSRIASLIAEFGLHQVREPHVKHLEGRLWEIRLLGRDGIARAIYVTAAVRRVVVVRVFIKKTQKTPAREMEIARRRAEEIE